MKPDIKNMTINEYIDYEAEKGRRLWDRGRITRDVDLEKEEAEVEHDGDDGDTNDIWDITVEEVERIRKFLTPNVLNG
nr:hypothetical protein [Tanacetum cinerariifolium]